MEGQEPARDSPRGDRRLHRTSDPHGRGWTAIHPAFGPVAVGDEAAVRGPLGTFTIRSLQGRPNPSLRTRQAELFPTRTTVLFLGATSLEDFYEMDRLGDLLTSASGLSATLVAPRSCPRLRSTRRRGDARAGVRRHRRRGAPPARLRRVRRRIAAHPHRLRRHPGMPRRRARPDPRRPLRHMRVPAPSIRRARPDSAVTTGRR